MDQIRVSFDTHSILNDLDRFELKWNQKMDLIHVSIVSRLDIDKSLYQYIMYDTQLDMASKKNVFWIMSAYADEALSMLPELPVDMQWVPYREYDLEMQTWVMGVPIALPVSKEKMYLERFVRYLDNEEFEGRNISFETRKHVSSYLSLLDVSDSVPITSGVIYGNCKSFYCGRS